MVTNVYNNGFFGSNILSVNILGCILQKLTTEHHKVLNYCLFRVMKSLSGSIKIKILSLLFKII